MAKTLALVFTILLTTGVLVTLFNSNSSATHQKQLIQEDIQN